MTAAALPDFTVISDESVRHADHLTGCRVYRVVTLSCAGQVFVQKFWHNADGSLHHVDCNPR